MTAPSATRSPRKWLGRGGGWIIFGCVTVVWLFNLAFDVFVVGAPGLTPNSIILGGLGMTAAVLYVLAYRVRPADGVSVARLLIAFGLGGFISTELAVVAEFFITRIPQTDQVLSHSLAGIVEEACKLVAVIVVSRGLVRKTTRNGLFIGGAVGLGFAALEDMRYAVDSFDNPDILHDPTISVIFVTLSRDLIGPFEHPIFTAFIAAAVFASTRNGRYRLTPRPIGVYLAVSAAHGLIDTIPILLFFAGLSVGVASGLGELAGILIAVGAGLIWLRVSRRLRAEAAITLRPATPDDLEFLTHTLVATANWDRDRGVTFDSVKTDPAIWHYLEGWQRPTDFGLIALDGERMIGAGWARFFTPEDAGYGFVETAIPELTLAVIPDARKRRVGRTILRALIQVARDRNLPGISLSVEDGNERARRLYLHAGFTVVGRVGNSDTLVLRLRVQPASPVGSGAETSLSSAPPTGSPSQ